LSIAASPQTANNTNNTQDLWPIPIYNNKSLIATQHLTTPTQLSKRQTTPVDSTNKMGFDWSEGTVGGDVDYLD
jgi:hypothetical protein